MDIALELERMGAKAKAAALELGALNAEVRNRGIVAMAAAIEANAAQIAEANAKDLANAKANGMSEAMLDRLTLTPARIQGMADGLREVAAQGEVVGKLLSSVTRPNGLKIDKISVPIGVIGIIYESRPNVTADAAGICLKAGNAVILRGGSEAINSNIAIAEVMNSAGKAAGIPDNAVQVVQVTGHDAVNAMLKLDNFIDLIIPRGGERLIRTVVANSTIPVIKHYKGVCHIFVDEKCDFDRALDIIENAKCSRPSACNAVETVLIHRAAAAEFAPKLLARLESKGVKIHGPEEFNKLTGNRLEVTEEEYFNEYLALELSAKIVANVEEAVEHINHYGSHHSDAILSAIPAHIDYFLARVDSATVYANASTRFTDGGEFGMGAEIGISTDKIHARGPMGAAELTSFKFLIHGEGQIR